ncbi:MAG: hypothetical protein J6I84_04195 [Bacilli bacterium]|nr:hypothetical protein [Bacilli bacterium]
MIQYRKSDGTLGEVDGNIKIEVNDHSLTIIKRCYGYDEYDFWDDTIEDVIELRIG